MRNLALILGALAFLSGCGSGGGESGSDEVTVDLVEQNGSGQSGTVVLTADGEKTTVAITLDNPPAAPQPAHIHRGSCSELDPTPAHGLQNVEGGESTTVVDKPLGSLRDEEFAVNVHKSGMEIDVYVACGDIGSESGETETGDDGYGY